MNLSSDTPFRVQLCFDQVIQKLEWAAADPANEFQERDVALLKDVQKYPELVEGIDDALQIEQCGEVISRLLADYFPKVLTLNEIKAVNIPYTNLIFNHTERFKNILKAAGSDFEINIRDFDTHQFYIIGCCMILYTQYGVNLDFSRPFFYDIPTENGVIKHYRILFNADFLEILPTEKSLPISPEEIDQLIDNYDDLELWKSKFPKDTWLLKGFSIITLFDATVESSVSLLKEKLLVINSVDFRASIESIFQSIYMLPDLKIGFTVFNPEEDWLSPDTFGQQVPSYILQNNKNRSLRELLCLKSYSTMVEDHKEFAISDTFEFLAKNPENPLARNFMAQNIQSFILAPVVKNNIVYGIFEVISYRKKELNSVNTKKLEIVMPFLTDTIERLAFELQNQIQAVIQDKFTSMHESVYWKFHSEAQKLIDHRQPGAEYELQEIIFPEVYPLYGQIDIKGSSDARNLSVQNDIIIQLNTLLILLRDIDDSSESPFSFQLERERLARYLTDLSISQKASTEQHISNYLEREIHQKLKTIHHERLHPLINAYFKKTEKMLGDFHMARRKYEKTISMINNKVASILDKRQPLAQSVYPHYYERFKTDGVEHNLYIGQSIAPKLPFDLDKLHAIRLWQLRVLCEMEIAHSRMQPYLPYPLDVTTLILVYHGVIDIRFRMDEKRFDVHGSYNARFEIIKKRIDKACILGTGERITQEGKITIVYPNDSFEKEYRSYIETLQSEKILESNIEKFEIEELQGVSGLKALRVKVAHGPLSEVTAML